MKMADGGHQDIFTGIASVEFLPDTSQKTSPARQKLVAQQLKTE